MFDLAYPLLLAALILAPMACAALYQRLAAPKHGAREH